NDAAQLVTRAFKSTGSSIRMTLDPAEVELLSNLRDGLEAALDDDDASDPVVRRLFPDPVDDDPQANRELHELLHDDLLASRREALGRMMSIIGRGELHRGKVRIELVDDEPQVVLNVVNDVRLAIGARIGIERPNFNPADEQTEYRLAIMNHLGWLQEQLLSVIDPAAVEIHRLDPPDEGSDQ
ncbi:MAG: DUF2017 family protein, partial [Nitriliruptoraceae bacterium]